MLHSLVRFCYDRHHFEAYNASMDPFETQPIINLDTFSRSASRRFLFQHSYFLYEQCLLHNSILLFIFSKVGGSLATPSARALISSSDSPERHFFLVHSGINS